MGKASGDDDGDIERRQRQPTIADGGGVVAASWRRDGVVAA